MQDPTVIEPRVDFYGLLVSSGKPSSIAAELSNEEGCSVSIHVTQVALGAGASAGPHTVFAVHDKKKFAIGTLEKGRTEQFSVDYMCTTDVAFQHTGQSEVYLTGYRHISPILDTVPGPGDEYETSEESDEESDEEAPALVQARHLQPTKLGALNAHNAKGKIKSQPVFAENTFGSDDDEDDDDDLSDSDLEGREGDSDEDEDDEEEAAAAAATHALLTSTGLKAKAKRPAAAAAAAAPAKKAKALSKPVAAGAPTVAPYAKAVKEYLAAHGPTRLSDLGSKVPKPEGVSGKISKILADSDLFSTDSKGVVSIK